MDFSITAFTATVGIYLNLEAYIIGVLTIGANVNTFHPREAAGVGTNAMEGFLPTERWERTTSAPADSADIEPRQKPTVNTQTNDQPGCFELDFFVDLNFGSDTDFFGLFPAFYKITFFRREFQLLKV